MTTGEDKELMLVINEDGTLSEYQEPYATIECKTEEDFKRLRKIVDDSTKYKWHDLREAPEDLPAEYATVEVVLSTVKVYDIAIYCKDYGFRPWYAEYFQDCPDEWKHKVMAWRYVEPFATDTNVGDKEDGE